MQVMMNPYRGAGLPADALIERGDLITDPRAGLSLFAACPKQHTTPVADLPSLAESLGIQRVSVKDERSRLGLGSFKALGAAFAVAKQAAKSMQLNPERTPEQALEGECFVCASAGNHGLSLAAGARIFGARAIVYLSETVPESFADRLRAYGAEVIRAGAVYEDSMLAAQEAAGGNGWSLISDSSWLGYSEPAKDVMEGYLIMTAELAEQLASPPTHVFVQAGVGGLAAAVTVAVRNFWGHTPRVIVVEPEAAPALYESIERGQPVVTTGPVSSMGRLDCKEPSHLALACLAREADVFVTVSDAQVEATVEQLNTLDLATSPSGAAGLSALIHPSPEFGLTPESHVLAYVTEQPT